MRFQTVGAALALVCIVGSSALRAAVPSGGSSLKEAGASVAPPIIDVWYGNDQRFGAIGTPQRWANILGSVSHPTGISTLKYTLNGGAARSLSFIPDTRRIANSGDFNIDLKFSELTHGDNSVVITAVANNGETAQSTVTVRNLSGPVWPLPYSCAWTQLVDSAQLVDGKWSLLAGGVRILEPGYDRLIALGDTTWTDYEATVKVTVHGLDSSQAAWDASSGGPGIGILMRWKGHTNSPVFYPSITQPLSGYIPLGAIGWFHWRKGWGYTSPNQWEIMTPGGTDLAVRTQNTTTPLYYGAQYYFKMQVKTIVGIGSLYKFRVWQVGSAEPSTWLMTYQELPSGLAGGSLVLLAHHVSATFGVVKITPTPDGIPPVITNINATPAATTATITWTTDEPASSSVAYGLTSSHGSIASDLVNLVTSHSIQLQNLTPSTTYHYTVTSADWGGASSTSSDDTFQTTILTPPLAPVLVSPGNGSSGNPAALTLLWNRSVTATGYRVQLGTDATFATGIIVHDSTLTDTLKAVSGLLPGTRYYWRVSARNTGGEGSFSSVSMFATAQGVPALASPVNGAMNISPTPTLSWYKVASATTYRVRVSTDSTLGGVPTFDDSTVVDTFRVASGLQVGQKYYWRVRAKNSAAIGTFSPAWAFTPGLAAPALVSPANGSTNQSVNSTLKWSSVGLATSYDVQLGTNPTFASGLVLSDSMLADTSRSVNGLAPGTVYYWRARARNASGAGQYSLAWWFSTGLAATQLLAPGNGSVDQPLSMSFRWGKVASATAYSFQLATDSTFTSGFVKNDSSVADTTRFVAGLSYKTTYYWHVRVRQGTLNGPWSLTWKLTTIPHLPDPVTLIQLADGVMVPPDSARFIWTQSQPGVNRYWFEIAFDSLFSLTSIDSSVVESTMVVHSFIKGATYFWRVRAGNTEGWGPFSQTRHFHVGPVVVVAERGLPSSFALDQNYPNPFNPSTWIHFALPKQSHVRLEVYNILGELVATIVDEGMEAGFHRVEFGARDNHGRPLAAGMYIYRLVTPEFTLARKMILLK